MSRTAPETFTDLNNHVRLGGTLTSQGTETFVNITATGNVALGTTGTNTVGFFGTTPATQKTVTGALSTVADAPAKAVLTSIIAALVAYGLAVDGTT